MGVDVQTSGPDENVHECICLAVEWVVTSFSNFRHCARAREYLRMRTVPQLRTLIEKSKLVVTNILANMYSINSY